MWVERLFHIREVLHSNLGPDTGYPTTFLMISSEPSGRCQNSTSHWSTAASFVFLFSSLFTNHRTVQHYIMWAVRRVVQQYINTFASRDYTRLSFYFQLAKDPSSSETAALSWRGCLLAPTTRRAVLAVAQAPG